MPSTAWFPNPDNPNTVIRGNIDRHPKRITGTRLGAILGVNHWKTPFQAWCEITRVAEPPFAGNKYTRAGEAIEPKLIDHMRGIVSPDVYDPMMVYGPDYFEQTRGNFFADVTDVFGGMWDALYYVDEELAGVIECKTSSRPQDWLHGVPTHYAVQGLLYAYLLGVEDVWFPVAFLTPDVYDDPESFECTDDNTAVFHLKVDDSFREDVARAEDWWETYVVGNVSPAFDEDKDADYLAMMRTTVRSDGLVDSLTKQIDELESRVSELEGSSPVKTYKELVSNKKVLTGLLKDAMIDLHDDERFDVVKSNGYSLKRSVRRTVDTDKMKEDGVYDKYTKESTSYRLTRTGE